jgi:hypothetical protein
MTDEAIVELSPYALTSALDGELIKTILLDIVALGRERTLCMLEWGSGLGTLSYTSILPAG